MAPARKVSEFYSEGNDWYCSAGLPSDITVIVESINFHLHKFPLVSKCGKIAHICEESETSPRKITTITLDEFPGGPSNFLIVAKFCYSVRVELTPRNIVILYAGADYLEMTEQYGEGNLISNCESFFHKNILRNWKDCILALQSCETVLPRAENLQLVTKCLNSLSTMVCTDPSLFGWPMMMYGSLQSPGGSILWNGINTGARIRSYESDWWFEDISYLSVGLFQKLITTMESRGIRPESIAGAVMYYARKYLPGLGRWHSKQSGRNRTVTSFSLTPAAVDQRVLLESIEKILPDKKGKSFCRFLLGLLRVALIIGVDERCRDSLEKRIGTQLELATLDGLLIPSYSDSETLYNTDSVEQMILHFKSTELAVTLFSPASASEEASPSSSSSSSSSVLRKVSRVVDNYMAEVASDVNLKSGKIRSLALALPEHSRPLHDGLYRALDIYLKAHPWLSEEDKEELCNIIDYQKLSIDACAHASQNERLPLRIVLQVLFFEQMQLRMALADCLCVEDTEGATAGPATADMAGQLVQRDGWVTVVRENPVLKVDMEKMRSRVGELEDEFSKIKQEMRRVTKSHSSLSSPPFGHQENLVQTSSMLNAEADIVEPAGATPRASVEQPPSSCHSGNLKSFSLF